MYRIILASNSPRRKDILEQAGVNFQIVPSQKEEYVTSNIPEKVVKELALLKANDVADKFEDNTIVIGADTVVANMGKILGKPADELEAVNMIMNLQGHSHD
ncbi:MAG: Maf family protein, partial [Lachnospiraceae bacterium]|nr:Maf family protein [Lachnospiraceae bacterium]